MQAARRAESARIEWSRSQARAGSAESNARRTPPRPLQPGRIGCSASTSRPSAASILPARRPASTTLFGVERESALRFDEVPDSCGSRAMHAENLDDVVEHNRPAAAMWSTGGDHYDAISFGIADALRHAVQRLSAKEGEEVLDVATGTGWAARLVARSGARVTGVDIAAGLIAAARHRSAHVMPRIEYRVADAERLPFADGRFDRVVSTFGVMFAGDHVRAARELARASAVSVDGSLWRPGRRTAQSPASSR